MSTVLVLVLAGLAAARTHRLFTIDGAGEPVRVRFDTLVYRIQPKSTRQSVMNPRRKDVSRRVWRRYSVAKSLSEGFYCRWCAPFWYGLAWLGTGLLWADMWIWQLLAGSLALSYVVGVMAPLERDLDDNGS